MTDINPCPPTLCLHVQLDHCQILNCFKYLKNPRPLNTEYREVLVQALGISLNFFLNKVLSTHSSREQSGHFVSVSWSLPFWQPHCSHGPRAFPKCSDVCGRSVADPAALHCLCPCTHLVVRIRCLFLGVVTC